MIHCPGCDYAVKPDDIFCENCGVKLRQDQSPPFGQDSVFQLPPSLGSWKTLRWLIVGGTVALISLGLTFGVFIVLFLQRLNGPQRIEVMTPKVVTATATSTPTPTPGPSPTPSPTGTPTPTQTPIPDTPSGTVLTVGDTWRQNGMTMRVEKFNVAFFSCTNIAWTAELWGKWQVVIENNTDQDLVVNMTKDNFFLIDDQGKQAGIGSSFDYAIDAEERCPPGHLELGILKRGQPLRLWGWGIGKIDNQQWFKFGVNKAGRIENAIWQFDIPR